METVFATLIEEFQTIAPELWAVMVRQARLEGWYNLIWCIVLVCLSVLLYFLTRLWLRKWRESNEEFYMWDWAWIGALLVCAGIVVLIALPLTLYTAVMNLSNPEFAAIRWLLGQITG